eukprot:5154425-Pyramimonas_sp.AAC.1
MCKLLLGKGARVHDSANAPSGHLAIEVDEYGVATEDKDTGSMAFTTPADPHSEDAPLHVKEAAGAGSSAGQPASSSAGAPATDNAHAYMMSQDTKGICFSINEETLAFAIQSLVNNTLNTWHRRNTSYGNVRAPADPDFALRNLQANVDRANARSAARAPAGEDDAAEKFDIFSSSSGSAAQHGTGIWTPPSLEH